MLLVDVVASRAEETLATIEEEGGEASVFEADITRSADCRAMVDATLAAHHGRDNIRVNCLVPGHLWTLMVSAGTNSPGATPMDEEHRDRRRRAGALGTEGTAWDIAWAVVFLASDEARWISGAVLPVDAGTSAMLPVQMFRLM